MDTLDLVIPTMFISGVLGGLINSYLSDPITEKPLKWWQHIAVGVGAAFMVPVFLNMISSGLISEISGQVRDPKMLSKLLVLAGFCLLAAISSRAFIRSLTDRLLQEVSEAKKVAQEAKQQAEDAGTIADLTVEPETGLLPKSRSTTNTKGLAEPAISEEEIKILQAMINSRFSMRSITGIAKDANLPKETVNMTISSLFAKGLIMEGKSKGGQPRWYPTGAGRSVDSET